MTIKNLEEFKRRIADGYDPEYVIDILGISTAELLEAFEDRLMEKKHGFSEMEDDAE